MGKTDGKKGGRDNRLLLTDRESSEHKEPINLPMETLFGKPPKLSRVVESRKLSLPSFDSSLATYLPKMESGFLEVAIQRVLTLPSVGSKSFLITIGDRYVYLSEQSLPSSYPDESPEICSKSIILTHLVLGLHFHLEEEWLTPNT